MSGAGFEAGALKRGKLTKERELESSWRYACCTLAMKQNRQLRALVMLLVAAFCSRTSGIADEDSSSPAEMREEINLLRQRL